MSAAREKLINLLREVLDSRSPGLLWVVDSIGKAPLSDDLKDKLSDVVSDELCATGLNPDGEPNERGILLDDLIDLIWSWGT